MSVQIAAGITRKYSTWEAGVALAAVLVSGAVGVALAVEPVLAFLPLGALVSALLLVDGRARIVFVLFGGLFVFQRGEGLDSSKLAFLAIFGIALLGAFVNVRTMWQTPAYRVARPLLVASTAMVALACLSLAVAQKNSTPLVGGWLRDMAPYLLFASAPVFALDAQASLSRRGLLRLLVTAGIVGAVAYAVYWLDRRGIAHLYASRIGLASIYVPAALFSYGMSAALHSMRIRWLAVSGFVLALLLVTGTRTNLVLLVAPLAIAFGARRHLATRSVRLALLGPVTLVITVILAIGVLKASNANEEFLNRRISIFESTGTSADNSYKERLRQARAAWRVFESNPLVGAGAGTTFEWTTIDEREISSFQLDTPVTVPAKFGVVGLATFALILAMYSSFVKSLVRLRGPTAESLALVGYLVLAAVSAAAYSPFEDKGLSFGLILLLALVLSDVAGGRLEERDLMQGERPATARD